MLVSLPDGRTIIYETDGWTPIDEISPDDGGGVISSRFSRDGSTLVTRSTNGDIAIRDPASFAIRDTIEGGLGAFEDLSPGPYLSQDGTYLLTVREAADALGVSTRHIERLIADMRRLMVETR